MSAQRWERIAAERGTRMDELQARAEAAEAALAENERITEMRRVEGQRILRERNEAVEALADARRALEEIGKGGVCQKWDVGDCNDSDRRLSEWACAPCRARRALAATENVS